MRVGTAIVDAICAYAIVTRCLLTPLLVDHHQSAVRVPRRCINRMVRRVVYIIAMVSDDKSVKLFVWSWWM